VTETGIAALHRYADGRPGTSRDHDAMLRTVYEQAVRHAVVFHAVMSFHDGQVVAGCGDVEGAVRVRGEL
jgi:hypothetical protein